MSIVEIDRARRKAGLTHAEFCRAARLHPSNWYDMRRGAIAPRAATRERMQKAIAGCEEKPPSVIAGFHRMVMARLAEETGGGAALMLAQDFSSERPNNPDWLRAARLRRCAIYIAAVELLVGNAVLGRAIGCTRANVKAARDWVEDRRSAEPELDALLDRVRALVTGRGE